MVDRISSLYDVVVVGGGVVGLAVLRAAILHGWKCVLVEAENDLLTQASGSNSGIICTGVDAAPGTLERALIRDSNSRFRLYCQAHNLPTRPCGSLVCLWPWDEQGRLNQVLLTSHDAGDTHARLLTPKEVITMEPNLAPSCRGAIHIPGEIVVDPWLYSISLGVHARENGATIITNFCFDGATSSFDGGVWTIRRKKDDCSGLPNTSLPMDLKAKCVVNAAGIFADHVQGRTHGTSRWTTKPRRGQYRIYNPSPTSLIFHPIQPAPSQLTKGIFVFSTLYNQLVVGPTATDQVSRTDRRPDSLVAKQLDEMIQRILPNLDTESACVGEYVGIRPGTNQRDYQIHLLPQKNWIFCAGIRSTGLTASLGIGDYVVRLLGSVLEAPTIRKPIQTTPLPPVSELIQDFHQRNDGHVVLQGYAYKVTHPLTRLGWQAQRSANPLSSLHQAKL